MYGDVGIIVPTIPIRGGGADYAQKRIVTTKFIDIPAHLKIDDAAGGVWNTP